MENFCVNIANKNTDFKKSMLLYGALKKFGAVAKYQVMSRSFISSLRIFVDKSEKC